MTSEEVTELLWQHAASITHDKEKVKYNRLLYHYTDMVALLNIISTKKLWATNVKFLNDSHETQYGHKIVKQIITKLLENEKSEEIIKVLKLTQHLLTIDDGITNTYIVCFSEKGDLLSQWKGYANQGEGVSIGFDPSILLNDLSQKEWIFVNLKKVIYDRKLQEELVIEVIIKYLKLIKSALYLITKNEEKDTIIVHSSSYLFYCLKHISHTIKNPVFSEEKEWRIILSIFSHEPDKQDILFRVRNNMITPYIELDTSAKTLSQNEQMPIKEIIVGSLVNHNKLKYSISLLDKEKDRIPTRIIKSKIPLQK
ncbi:DUF2971 domain-containing protein [Seleniivibrio woodruffii]|uniref:DUF2971 family protein n=1 Tax=Seleniivibrio woodruffii TaxID=1078050 RepID=A0A4R1KCS8_9BACT|nr:DUF2971 domain-containing protein [Seleniivibrio woodruffii]TCK62332.1 hypothetical protein C8D98_0856 [Seleniivibrio woodruffii]TVZ34551.1 Protein of unknown function (DUF2971) [Seleniivibrio woodruffii]